MSKPWYAKSFRRNLVDMHIDDWDENFLCEFNPDAYYECLKLGNIQSAMIYLQSHVGLCNWDTVSGRAHRAFAGENKIRRLIDFCHSGGIDVIAYYSLIYNNWAYDAHPEWRIRHLSGAPSRVDAAGGFMSGGRYGLVCPNNAEYRNFVRAQLTELCARYPFEGIFLDMTFWPTVCYCDACRARYRAETGKELPELVDWTSDEWRAFQEARGVWLGEFAAYCTELLHTLKPGVSVEHQFSTICHGWGQAVTGRVNAQNDYAGGDLYGGHLQQSYICKAYREATKNQPFEYMTSRCDPNLQVHTTTKSLRDLLLHDYLTLAHHGAFLVIDAIDPVGTLDPRVYRRIGEMFRETAPYEKYMRGDLVAEAALIMSYESKFDAQAAPAPVDSASRATPQLEAQLGMARILREMGMTYTVLPSDRLSRLEGKRLACLTNAAWLRPEEIEQIAAYVEAGGCLYLSGTSDPRLCERLLGLRARGYTAHQRTYIAPTAAGEAYFEGVYTQKYPLAYSSGQMLCECPEAHEVLATIALPYTLPDDSTVFASIHSNPPGISTKDPAIVLGHCGKGLVLWLAAAPEVNAQAESRRIVSRLVRRLCVPETLLTDAPGSIETTLFFDREARQYILHLVNLDQSEYVHDAPSFRVSLRLPEGGARAVALAPAESDVPFETENGRVTFETRPFTLFATYLISLN